MSPIQPSTRRIPFGRRALRVAAVTGGGTVLLLATALPAAAHVELTPDTAAPGQFLVYTVSVPNERDDSATTAVDLKLPPGFILDAAQAVSGWRTVVAKSADGTPTQVTWTGGRIPVGTFATFQLQGRNPSTAGPLTWRAVQHYEHVDVAWDGEPGSETPAPVVTLSAKSVPATGSAADPATAATKPASGVDQLARSRAALAIAVGVAGLLVGLLPTVVAFGRRRRVVDGGEEPEVVPNPPRSRPAASKSGKAPSGRR
ncbi:MAG TPA: DUF1775 domain-containing protein [Frankiaceae bacterium]|nr:DUF1775 domain-containing protein [Frankiaceae bacterium]